MEIEQFGTPNSPVKMLTLLGARAAQVIETGHPMVALTLGLAAMDEEPVVHFIALTPDQARTFAKEMVACIKALDAKTN